MNRLARRIHRAVLGHEYLPALVEQGRDQWAEQCLRCRNDRRLRRIGGGWSA